MRHNPDIDGTDDYRLDQNVGYLLRRCYQESTAAFVRAAPPQLSAPRFAALARLAELGPLPQNRLGRLISADAATIKGIVDRLRDLGAVETAPDPDDRRQRLVTITETGRQWYAEGVVASRASASRILAALSDGEARIMLELLDKMASATLGSPDP
ncbi:MarR family winged helix-turn-helix transcriptional regulator [Gordonia sp. CPCC 206044]|uniref:MarR family winged helix-turn-helix transcriptional regulator n=1 Tax=Gordonia sp. CPCC 206044 TaxID=3140793 RepID=UPI003AF33B73